MFKNKTVKIGIIVICFYMLVTTTQGIWDLWRGGDKITSREKTLAALLSEREDLQRRKNQVEQPDYLERVAYDKLGLARQGEEIIIVPKELLADKNGGGISLQEPNWKKWLRLVF